MCWTASEKYCQPGQTINTSSKEGNKPMQGTQKKHKSQQKSIAETGDDSSWKHKKAC